MLRYSEPELVERLGLLGQSAKTAFASACAQWLFPLFERYAQSIGAPELSHRLGVVLSEAWAAADGGVRIADAMQSESEALVPIDEDGWTLEMGYGQNAAAATAYAVRTWLTDRAQEAAWAARQVYEAADYATLQAHPDLDLNAPGSSDRVLASPAVQSALMAIGVALEAVEAQPSSYRSLRERCELEGRSWAASLP